MNREVRSAQIEAYEPIIRSAVFGTIGRAWPVIHDRLGLLPADVLQEARVTVFKVLQSSHYNGEPATIIFKSVKNRMCALMRSCQMIKRKGTTRRSPREETLKDEFDPFVSNLDMPDVLVEQKAILSAITRASKKDPRLRTLFLEFIGEEKAGTLVVTDITRYRLKCKLRSIIEAESGIRIYPKNTN
jgi:DNA-directed RNA polymerase specialized sigma24 family protein